MNSLIGSSGQGTPGETHHWGCGGGGEAHLGRDTEKLYKCPPTCPFTVWHYRVGKDPTNPRNNQVPLMGTLSRQGSILLAVPPLRPFLRGVMNAAH